MPRLEDYAVLLLLQQSVGLHQAGRFNEALGAARKALEAARSFASLPLEIRSVYLIAEALRLLGNTEEAFKEYTWILTTINDPSLAPQLQDPSLTSIIASTYKDWVETASFLPEIETSKLFGVLDAGEAFVRASGHPEWRGMFLHQRARLFEDSGEATKAIPLAEEALDLGRRFPEAPGVTLGTSLRSLAELYRGADRAEEAIALLEEAVSLDDLFDQKAAHDAWARCELALAHPEAAREHAEQAVHLAESLGEDALVVSLSTLLDACLAAGDVPGAQRASERAVKLARRLPGTYQLYFALRDAAQVELESGALAAARGYLEEVTPLAAGMDRHTGTNEYSAEIERYKARLREAEAQQDGRAEPKEDER